MRTTIKACAAAVCPNGASICPAKGAALVRSHFFSSTARCSSRPTMRLDSQRGRRGIGRINPQRYNRRGRLILKFKPHGGLFRQAVSILHGFTRTRSPGETTPRGRRIPSGPTRRPGDRTQPPGGRWRRELHLGPRARRRGKRWANRPSVATVCVRSRTSPFRPSRNCMSTTAPPATTLNAEMTAISSTREKPDLLKGLMAACTSRLQFGLSVPAHRAQAARGRLR